MLLSQSAFLCVYVCFMFSWCHFVDSSSDHFQQKEGLKDYCLNSQSSLSSRSYPRKVKVSKEDFKMTTLITCRLIVVLTNNVVYFWSKWSKARLFSIVQKIRIFLRDEPLAAMQCNVKKRKTTLKTNTLHLDPLLRDSSKRYCNIWRSQSLLFTMKDECWLLVMLHKLSIPIPPSPFLPLKSKYLATINQWFFSSGQDINFFL